MWILRELNPWQDQTIFYETNYVVYCSKNKEDVLRQKRVFELEKISMNPLPNFFEYWDVDRDAQLIELHNYLVEKHDFKILDVDGIIEVRELEIDEVLHGVYPDKRFTEDDLIAIQNLVGVYYYKLDFITEKDKYFLVATPDFYEEKEHNMTFKLYDSELEAIAAKEKIWHQEELIIVKS